MNGVESPVLDPEIEESEGQPEAEVIEVPKQPEVSDVKIVGDKEYTAKQWADKQKEIVEKAIASDPAKPYKVFGKRVYQTKEDWDTRQKEIIAKAMAKGKVGTASAEKPEPAVEPVAAAESKPVKTQLDVAMERANKIAEERAAEERTKVKAEQEQIEKMLLTKGEAAVKVKPRAKRGSPEEAAAGKELLNLYAPVEQFQLGEKVQVAGEQGDWEIAAYFPDINQYEIAKGTLTLNVPAEKISPAAQTTPKSPSWLTGAMAKVKSWFKTKPPRNNTVFPRS